MAKSFVVDTNVLIVASAAHDGSPFRPDATPVQDASLRREVLNWLQEFEVDAQRYVVLDVDWHICGEYRNKLNLEQDYGWLAMMAKIDSKQVQWVGIRVDRHGHATLPQGLRRAVKDLADRKMVAAVLAAQKNGDNCKLVNACDTDWLDCESELKSAGVDVHQLLPKWLKQKSAAKK